MKMISEVEFVNTIFIISFITGLFSNLIKNIDNVGKQVFLCVSCKNIYFYVRKYRVINIYKPLSECFFPTKGTWQFQCRRCPQSS